MPRLFAVLARCSVVSNVARLASLLVRRCGSPCICDVGSHLVVRDNMGEEVDQLLARPLTGWQESKGYERFWCSWFRCFFDDFALSFFILKLRGGGYD